MNQMTILRIIVPTLNRPKAVMANLKAVINSCGVKPANIEIQLRVSENGSDADLKISKDEWNRLRKLCEIKDITLLDRVLKDRLSLGQHMHDLLGEVGADWQLWIGDDDLLSEKYIEFCFDVVKKKTLPYTFFASGFCTISEDEFYCTSEKGGPSRYTFNENSNSLSHPELFHPYYLKRGHQLSGLLIKSLLIDACLKRMNPENLYPWITFSVEAVLQKKAWISSDVGVLVTSDTPKLFSYAKNGLMPDICEAVNSAPSCAQSNETAKFVMNDRSTWSRMFYTGSNVISQLRNVWNLKKDERIPKDVWRSFLLRYTLLAYPLELIRPLKKKVRSMVRR